MNIRVFLLPVAVVGLLALSAPTALAHEFIQRPSKTGFGGKGGTQTFTINGHPVKCAAAHIKGGLPEEKYPQLGTAVTYEGCTAFSKTATVSEAKFLFKANGTGSIAEETSVVIHAKPATEGECVIALAGESASKGLSKVAYTNIKPGIVIAAALSGIGYELKETGTTACGKNGEKAATGEYKGELTTETFAGQVCTFYWFFFGEWSDSACTEKFNAFFDAYKPAASFTSLEWF